MYSAPIYSSSPTIVTPQSIFDAIREALQTHVRNTIVFPCVPPLAITASHHNRACAAFRNSRFFAFEPAVVGLFDDLEAIVAASVNGYATVTDADMQRQLSALGLTCSIAYEVTGDMAEADGGTAKAMRMVEDTMDVTFEVF